LLHQPFSGPLEACTISRNIPVHCRAAPCYCLTTVDRMFSV